MAKANRKSKKVTKMAAHSDKKPQRKLNTHIVSEEASKNQIWACFKFENRNGTVIKVPIDAKTGKRIRKVSYESCSTLAEAIEAIDRYPQCDGVAFLYNPWSLMDDLLSGGIGWVDLQDLGKAGKYLANFQNNIAKLCA